MAEPIKEIPKPLPEVTSVTKPFWDATAEGKLLMQKCAACGAWVWCPRPQCGECRGEVFAFTVIREVVGRALRGFEKDIPYVTAWIDLEEGPRICSNVVSCPI